MAREYSGRFSRWKVRPPGFGFAVADASIVVSSALTSASCVGASGRGDSGGGIMPACSLRIIFSATSAFCAACATSNAASDRPPVFLVSLWQVTQ